MSCSRYLFLIIALALAVPGCHDEENVTVVTTTSTGFSAPIAATGFTAEDEAIMGADVGSDGVARLVFLRTSGGTTQLRLARGSGGSWSAAVPVSADDADAKTVVQVFTSANGLTHVLWLEGNAVHYARVNASTPPGIDAADAIISSGAGTLPSNVTAGATQGAVDELTAVINRSSNDVYALWTQNIDDDAGGGGVADEVPVVARLTGGTGAFGEFFALVDPNTDGAASTAGAPVLQVSSAGVAHALWAGPLATGVTPAVRHSSRTGVGTWSGGAGGDDVSDGGTAPFTEPALFVASDGDAYAVWREGTTIRAAYRAVGAGSTFAAAGTVVAGIAAGVNGMVAALEPGTEHFHVFWRIVSGGSVNFDARSNTTANLGGAWSATVPLHGPFTFAGATDMVAWADSTNRVVFAFHAPLASGDMTRMLVRTRPTGVASVFTAVSDLAPPGLFNSGSMAVGRNTSGTAVIAWRHGEEHAPPLAEIRAVIYSSGGTFAASVDVSVSPTLGSHGPLAALMTSGGTAHVFWHETTVGPDVHDIYHTQRP